MISRPPPAEERQQLGTGAASDSAADSDSESESASRNLNCERLLVRLLLETTSFMVRFDVL